MCLWSSNEEEYANNSNKEEESKRNEDDSEPNHDKPEHTVSDEVTSMADQVKPIQGKYTRYSWIADSGASYHMTNSDEGMFDVQPIDKQVTNPQKLENYEKINIPSSFE